MNDIYNKDEYAEADINSLIDAEAEENINLEFKEARALGKEDKKKNEISKDVSAFANSDGGIIIYGIEEENHKANAVSFIDGDEFTKEWLEQIIHSKIRPKIEDVRIFPVRDNADIKKSIYVVKIPVNSGAPYQASDKKYYKRYNFQTLPMEEYEVRNLYSRILPTKLKLLDPIADKSGSSPSLSHTRRDLRFTLKISIKNIGNTIEKDYKLEVLLPIKIGEPSFRGVKQVIDYQSISQHVFSVPNQSTIFQGEIINYNLRFKIAAAVAEEVMSSKLICKLYYSSDFEKKDFVMGGILKVDGRPVELKDFEYK